MIVLTERQKRVIRELVKSARAHSAKAEEIEKEIKKVLYE